MLLRNIFFVNFTLGDFFSFHEILVHREKKNIHLSGQFGRACMEAEGEHHRRPLGRDSNPEPLDYETDVHT